MESKQVGNLGERIAEKFLRDKGYQILDRNYSFWLKGSPQKGEIDIVARKEETITFVEVKTLTESNRGPSSVGISPEEKVNFSKQRKIIKTAQSWLMKKKIPLDSRWQIDVIAIKIDAKTNRAKVQHFKNAVF